MFSLQDKKVLITGGYQGIGLATAKRFVTAGAEVIIVDIEDATDIAAEIGARYIYADIADEKNVENAMQQAVKFVGKLDVVINNAATDYYGPTIEEIDAELLERITAVNHFGTIWGMKHAPKHMNDGGSIINNSTFAALIGIPNTGTYSSTKTSGIILSKIAAQELGNRKIRVNVVCPGYIETSLGIVDEEHHRRATKNVETFTALKRWGKPEDVAGLFHYLAADESSYVTGQIFIIDGGWMAGISPQLWNMVGDY